MKTPKTDQLRVRLTEEQRRGLQQLLRQRGKNETLSDLVREVIQELVSPLVQGRVRCWINYGLHKDVEEVAALLDRKPDLVLNDVVKAMLQILMQPGHDPLLLMEYRLREKYQKDLTGQVPSPAEALGRADSVSADVPPPSVKNQQKGTP